MVDPRDDNCGEANPVSDVPYDVSHVVKSAEKFSDADKVQFLENCCRPTPSCSNLDTQYWKSGNLNKHIKFQIKWLAYSARPITFLPFGPITNPKRNLMVTKQRSITRKPLNAPMLFEPK